jgi:hypothetical protein
MGKKIPEWNKLFTYSDGELLWAERPRSHFPTARGWRCFDTRFAGKKAGTGHSMGYWQIGLGGSIFLAHRIIWEMFNGPVPKGMEIDHKDGDKMNNKIENLRLCLSAQNKWNAAFKKGYMGFAGVSYDKRRKLRPFYVRLTMHGKVIIIGRYATPEEAHEAWKRATSDLRGSFSVVNRNNPETPQP